MAENPEKRVRTLDRGLVLLETLAGTEDGLGLTELSQRCGLDKSTAYRLLMTLLQRGYVRQNARTRRYSLGLKIFDLYDAAQNGLGLQEVCRPFLRQLLEVSGETSHLAVLSGWQIVFLDTMRTHQIVGVRTQIGRYEPAYCTALGKAVLAALPREEAMSLFKDVELRAYTALTPTSLDALAGELDRVAETGYAVDNEEFIAGVRCVATPVMDVKRQPAGAIGISGPATRLSAERCAALGDVVRRIGESASEAMGYSVRRAKTAQE